MKKNLFSVAQPTFFGRYVLFGVEDDKVYGELNITKTPMMEGRKLDSVFVLPTEAAYVDKARKK